MKNQVSFMAPMFLKSLVIPVVILSLAACIALSGQTENRDTAAITEDADATAQNKISDTVEYTYDHGESAAVDITNAILTNRSANCAEYVNNYTSDALDVFENIVFRGVFTVSVENGLCTFTSNSIPNHDFNDSGGFFAPVQEYDVAYRIAANPQKNDSPTSLTLMYDNGIMLNGIKVDLLAAACYGVGDGRIGCNDMSTPWRYDPLAPAAHFDTDSHNAHTQPGGGYHYHGNPKALFDDSDGSAPSPVIGFAADGFPILGSYFDDSGTIRKALSSYQLRSGARPTDDGSPGGTYDGTFVDDYEYIEASGDLDECNGMTVDGVYGYYVTDSYPHILGCFSGTPDDSFRKRR